MTDSGIISNDDKSILYDLVAELRQLPDDLPPPDEMDSPEEHPMMKLMLEKENGSSKCGQLFNRYLKRLSYPLILIPSIMGNRHSDFIP